MVISPLINCSEPITSTIPYLSHIFLEYCRLYKPSGTQFMGTLEPSDCNNTLTFEHRDPPLCLYHCLPAGFSETCTLMFLFPKLGVLPGEESLLILITWFIDAWYNKLAIQVLPFLT